MKKRENTVRQDSREERRNKCKRGGMDVLLFMLVTTEVFHFERSELNLEALWNAVGVRECPHVVDPSGKERDEKNNEV